MSHTKHLIHASLGAFSILVIGIVVGVWFDRVVLRPDVSDALGVTSHPSLDDRHGRFLQELTADLGLTETQVNHVHEVLGRHQSSVTDAWTAVHSLLDAAIDSVTSEIEAILDPGQRERLHDWLLEWHGWVPTHDEDDGQ